ncbi:MAG: hypothetical protein U0835_10925 [Isosphaeraceae bacterium]
MQVTRRSFVSLLSPALAAACLAAAAGCSGGGPLSGEPKKYEGGGPLPEMKGEEVTDEPSAKSKGKAKKR